MESDNPLPNEYRKEGLHFEAKSAPDGIPPDFWETYSAFANTFGGRIVLGISEGEDGSLYATGVRDPKKMVKVLWDNLNNPRFVNCNILTEGDVRIEECGDVTLVAVDVPAADRRRRPVYIRNSMNSGTFKRNDEGDYHCRIDEIKQMIRDSGDDSQDDTVIETMDMDCFDDATLGRYLTELSSIRPGHPWARIDRGQFLQLSGAAVEAGGILHPTVAGLLMFGKVNCIRRAMNGYFLDYRERSTEERWDLRIHSNSGDWSGNVYDFVTEVMTRLSLKIGSKFEMRGYTNTNGSDTYIAVREAVMNGVIHADYRLGGGVIVEWSPAKVKVTNPGPMRIPMKEAKKGIRSDPRNNTLMAMAMAVGWVERIGSGIFVMEKAVSEGHLLSVSINEMTDPSAVETVLELPVPDTGSSCKANEVLAILRERPQITRQDLASELGVSISTVSNRLASLREAGRIRRIGGNKNGRWELI